MNRGVQQNQNQNQNHSYYRRVFMCDVCLGPFTPRELVVEDNMTYCENCYRERTERERRKASMPPRMLEYFADHWAEEVYW
jgi:hypothetical protein